MKIITLLYILFFSIKKCFNYIVYPLKVNNELNKIENYLSFNSTYTTLEMGKPTQKIIFYFSLDDNKMNLTDINCPSDILFNTNISKTLTIIGYPDKNKDSFTNKVFAKDEITFYDNINMTHKVTPDQFYLYYNADITKKKNYLCGSIGLSIIKNEIKNEDKEIEHYLELIRNQSQYFSFFHYNNQDFFVNNIFLHEEFKDLFKNVTDIAWVSPIMKDNSLKWEIYMREIYYNKMNIRGRFILELNPLFELIIGSNEFKKNILKDFFNDYINNKSCLINEINGYEIIECDTNGFGLNDIKKFPDIYMFNNKLNHIFELIGEELFIKLNNKYYFGIIFDKNSQENRWVMGKIFLRKYPVIFSPINKKIGFYIIPNGDMNKDVHFYLHITIIILLLTCFCIYNARKLVYEENAYYNELIDEKYDNENKYIDKNLKKKKEKYIEMNIL